MSTRRGRLAAQRAERQRCPKCDRKAALRHAYPPGQAVTYCRWDDCDYERVTDLTAGE